MNPCKIKNLTLPHRLILAPMCGITVLPFRKICKEFGAGLVFNQMVSAKALVLGCQKTQKLLEFDESERPIGMQVFGNNPDDLAEAAKIIEKTGPDLIDLNLGCPAKKIVTDGGGSALLNDPERLKIILSRMREAIEGVFTVKIRAGWDNRSKNATEIALMAQNAGVDALTIHARTRSQGYSGQSDWEGIKAIKNALKIPVIGNGDVFSGRDAYTMMQQTGCDAVMTGRAAFKSPWIFKNFLENNDQPLSQKEMKALVLKQYAFFMEYCGTTAGIKMMRKFICAYSKGIPTGAHFRNEMVRLTDWDVIQEKIEQFFSKVACDDSQSILCKPP